MELKATLFQLSEDENIKCCYEEKTIFKKRFNLYTIKLPDSNKEFLRNKHEYFKSMTEIYSKGSNGLLIDLPPNYALLNEFIKEYHLINHDSRHIAIINGPSAENVSKWLKSMGMINAKIKKCNSINKGLEFLLNP